ncbi:TPA: hypothetical protein ACX8VE_001485 [Campylobacter jejuni]
MKKNQIENLKHYFQNNKKKSIFIIIGFILIFLTIFIILTEPKKDNFADFKDISKVEKNKNSDIKPEYIPPKIDSPFIIDDKKDTNLSNTNIKNEEKNKIADVSDNTFEQLKQEEAIKQIQKTQRPEDMIVFLKDLQKDIQLQNSSNTFKYDLKEYKVGDKFLNWFEIEDINRNFIRFRDEKQNYSYNLRFLGE